MCDGALIVEGMPSPGCVDGGCKPGGSKVLKDCSLSGEVCSYDPQSDQPVCMPGCPADSENPDGCVTDYDCADWNICNGLEVCDCVQGCVISPEPPCVDENPCTLDYCNEGGPICEFPGTPLAPCDDGDPCTVNDQCSACPAEATACDDLGNPICEPGTWICGGCADPDCETCLPKFTGEGCTECVDPNYGGEKCDICLVATCNP